MKPKVDDKKCSAIKNSCKAITACPVGAITYIEVEKALERDGCGCTPSLESAGSCGCSCDCGGGTPNGRIIIDHDVCTECGLCVEECCGAAIYIG